MAGVEPVLNQAGRLSFLANASELLERQDQFIRQIREQGVDGLDWSPDGRTFYFAESFAHVIHAYDFDPATGALANRRDFARVDPATGAFPDGLTVDAQGFVWNAQPVYGRIVRYDPAGRIDRIVETPVSRPTSCSFGGPGMATLYVTSARETLGDAELAQEPSAGGLFAFRPGVRGLPATALAG